MEVALTPVDLALAEAKEQLRQRLRTGAYLNTVEFPPLQWAVPGLIPEGFGLVVGPPKLGKSWFVLGLGLSVACGGKFLGRIAVEQRPVLYAALEDGDRRMQDRARKLMRGDPIPEQFTYLTDATPNQILAWVEAWLDDHTDGLVLLDTLGKIMPMATPGESSYQRDYRVGGRLKSLTSTFPGSTLLTVHHNRKMTSGDWMDQTSGTQGLNGAADFTLLLERGRGDGEAVAKVTGRDVTENEYALSLSEGSWHLQGGTLTESAERARRAAVSSGLGDDSSELLNYVHGKPNGVTPKQAADAMGWDNDKAGRYLRRLAENGRLQQQGRGLYTSVRSDRSVRNDEGGQLVQFPFNSNSDTPDTSDTTSGGDGNE